MAKNKPSKPPNQSFNRDAPLSDTQHLTISRRGLSGILTEESFTIRQILLVGQERPSEEDSQNTSRDSPVPAYRVNEMALYDCQCLVLAAVVWIRSTE